MNCFFVREKCTPETPGERWCGIYQAHSVQKLFWLVDADIDPYMTEFCVIYEDFGVMFKFENIPKCLISDDVEDEDEDEENENELVICSNASNGDCSETSFEFARMLLDKDQDWRQFSDMEYSEYINFLKE